jgi:uncharacterized membrane protein
MRDSEITGRRQYESCTWTSSDGIVGVVRFEPAPGARGTEVHVEILGPQRTLGTGIARVLGMAPDQLVREDLRRFKQLLESGEITLSDGPSLSRPAQPAANPEQITAFAGGLR